MPADTMTPEQKIEGVLAELLLVARQISNEARRGGADVQQQIDTYEQAVAAICSRSTTSPEADNAL